MDAHAIAKLLSDPTVPLSPKDRRAIEELALVTKFDWAINGRPSQQPPPGQWRIWLIFAGRGWGKTRTGAEAVNTFRKKGHRQIGLIAPTAPDARDVMIEGVSGVMNVAPPWDRPSYYPTKRRVTWPDGSQGIAYSAEEPERLRGPQHSLLWGDEPASWRYAMETFDMAMFGLRVGTQTHMVLTGTPKPTELIKMLFSEAVPAEEMRDGMKANVVITIGDTYENQANLSQDFIAELEARYAGTRQGLQEIYAKILDDNPNAIFKQSWFDSNRLTWMTPYHAGGKYRLKFVNPPPSAETLTLNTEFEDVVVSIDPATTSKRESNETGLVVGARDKHGRGYFLQDLSGTYSPEAWANRAIHAARRWGASRIVAERNQGGEMVEHTIRSVMGSDLNVDIRLVSASRNKAARAEPISALCEKGDIFHIGEFPALESQLVEYIPGEKSPSDRFDAYNWLFDDLLVSGRHRFFMIG